MTTLVRNNYPEHILDLEIAKFVRNRTKLDELAVETEDTNTVPKIERFITLPYFSKKADEFGRKLTTLVNSTFPLVDLKVAFKAPMEIGKLFRFKDKVTEVLKQSLVVYHIKCRDCEANYVGKTSRMLTYRLEEHKKSKNSALLQHHLTTKHTIDYDGVEILDRANTDRKLQIKELLHIDQMKPSLNTQLNSQSKYRIHVNIFGSKKPNN
jgi:hypothetical protein